MNSDDTPVPGNDPIAFAARHALGEIAELAPAEALSWTAVQAGARRSRQRRAAVIGMSCAIVVVGAGAAIAMTGRRDDRGQLRVAAGSTTTTPTTGATTSTPNVDNSSSAPPQTDPTSSPGGTVGPTTTVAPSTANETPEASDVTGTISVGSGPGAQVVAGTPIDITTNIRNIGYSTIWASSSTVPASYATVCYSHSSAAPETLWWMTNALLAPGDTDGRTGTFNPTAAYAGNDVTCELDLVTTDQQGTTYDTSAGGDMAQATLIARAMGVPAVTFHVNIPLPATNVPPGVPPSTTTSVPAATTTVP